jgi:hypothetical protein
MFNLTISGIKGIQNKLKQVEKKEAARLVREVTRSAQNKIMLPAYKKAALSIAGEEGRMSGLIAKNLAVRAMTKMKPRSYGHKVLIKSDEQFVTWTKGAAFDTRTRKLIKGTGARYYIPNAIEYGHVFPGRGGRKNAPKDVPAKPFARVAFEAHRKEVMRYTIDTLKKELDRFAQKRS